MTSKLASASSVSNADNKVGEALIEDDYDAQNQKTLAEMMTMQMKLRKAKAEAKVESTEQDKPLGLIVEMMEEELRYLYESLKILRSKEPEAVAFRNSVGAGAGNIRVLASAIKDVAGRTQADLLLKKSAEAVITKEKAFMAGQAIN